MEQKVMRGIRDRAQAAYRDEISAYVRRKFVKPFKLRTMNSILPDQDRNVAAKLVDASHHPGR
jgi:hypothetical protein